MSHVSKIEIEEKYDFNIIKQMCLDNKWKFCQGQTQFKQYYGSTDCLHAIKIPGADYEIGVIKDEEGEWQLVLDEYMSGGLANVRARLKQSYGIATAKVTAKKNRYRFYERKSPVGIGWKRIVVEI